MKRRLLASLSALCLLVGLFPTAALAAGTGDEGVCPHHTEHTAECEYVAPTEGTPCTHAHTAECYSDGLLPAEGTEKAADTCIHIQHDETCGYSEGSEGSPCTFVCNICPVEAVIEALPDYSDAAEEDVADVKAAQAAYDALTEEEQAAVNPELAAKLADLSDLTVFLTNAQNTSDAEPLADDNMSGNCGTDGNESSVTWKLDKNDGDEGNSTYTLTISGEGQMADFSSNDVPWKKALSDANATYTDKTTNGEDGKPKTFYPITKIVIEDGVTSIGNNAFSYTDVSEITIPDSVTTIGSGVFTWTLQLKDIHIPASVTNLHYTAGDDGEYTYYNTFDGAFNLENITVENGSDNYAVVGGILIGKIQSTKNEWMIINCPDRLDMTQISASIFSDYDMTAVGRTAFSACGSLTAIDLPDTISEIGAGAFNKCYSLQSFSVPDGVTEFGGNFRGCSSLQSVDWNNVTSITVADVFAPFWEDENDGEEHLCAVAETDLSKVTHIAGGAFQNSQLESVTFSTSSDLYIGARAFAECEKWEMPELDFSYGDYVAFDAFEGTPAYNVIFPNAQDENAAVQLLRGQRVFSLESLEAAFDAVEDGDTILLLRDVELSATETVLEGEKITLDLNGKVLKFTGESGRPLLVYGTLNLQDSDPNAVHYYTEEENGLWKVCESGEGEKEITGGIITGGDHKQFSGGAIMVSGGTLNMSGGNIIGNQAVGASGGIATSDGAVNISGGSVMGNVSAVGGKEKVSDLSGGGYSISGGTFTTPVDPAWCSGLLQPYDNGDGTYTVKYQGQGVARIGSVYYSTFNEAFEAAKEMSDENVTIVVTEDITLTAVCSLNGGYTGPNITVDLNGHVLTAAENQRLFTIQAGTLNIQDSDPDAVHYYTEEESGLWKVCKSDDKDANEIHGGIITGGNFTNSGGAIVVTANATVNMFGGNIIGNKTTNNTNASGGVNVAGGSFKMTGGTIQGNIYESGDKTGVRDINGGTITGGIFTTDVTEYLPEEGGYSCAETAKDSGIYVVTKNVEDDYTIAAIPDQVYTGKAIEPSIIVIDGDGQPLETGEYAVEYSRNTDVGEATATIEISNEGTEKTEIDVTFRIIRDENPVITMSDVSVTFGSDYSMKATAKTSANNEISGDGVIDIEYFSDPGCTEGSKLENDPTDAGMYYVKATLTGTENYAEVYTVAKLTINPGSFEVSATGGNVTYDGQSHSISVEADEDVTITYSRNGYEYNTEKPEFKEAGTYTVYYKAEKSNHDDVTGSLTVEINKATLTATYAGEVIREGQTPGLEVSVTGFVNGETASTASGYTAPTVTNYSTAPGQYTLTPSGGEADNYTFNYVSGTLVIWSSSTSSGGGSNDPSYSPVFDISDGGEIKVNPRTPEEDDEVTITVDPDAGYELDELIVTDRNGREIDVTAERDGTYTFIQPRGRVTIEATFVRTGETADLPFVDVPASAYYYDAVAWAVENGVTGGTTATTFSPNNACTRAQMVTFLWRAAGEPEPETTVNPFTDVSTSAYYYEAVLWAVERGITNGTSATTFSPDTTVTRGQTVTFLWRNAGSPAASGSSFADVAADAYYATAVAWAANEGITSGTSATAFSPSNACTRAQIVTFLWRYLG